MPLLRFRACKVYDDRGFCTVANAGQAQVKADSPQGIGVQGVTAKSRRWIDRRAVDLKPAAPCGGDVAGFVERGRQITSRHGSPQAPWRGHRPTSVAALFAAFLHSEGAGDAAFGSATSFNDGGGSQIAAVPREVRTIERWHDSRAKFLRWYKARQH
jgi:hypothetical protein